MVELIDIQRLSTEYHNSLNVEKRTLQKNAAIRGAFSKFFLIVTYSNIFLAEAVCCSAYLLNRLPSSSVLHAYPYQKWYKLKPDLAHLRPFGCAAYAFIPQPVRSSKLSPRPIRGVMVGYADTQHAYRIFDFDSASVVVSNDEYRLPSKLWMIFLDFHITPVPFV